MKNFYSLKFLDLFRGIFLKLGIDYPMMRKILELKLVMDQRRVPTIFNQSAMKKKGDSSAESNHFLKSMWLYGLLGLFLIPIALMGENFIFQMSIVFGIFMFLAMSSMISDFSSVLLDLRDKQILYTKPIDRRTIGMAKTIHVTIYLFFISFFLMAGVLVASLMKYGVLFFFLLLVEVFLMNLFIVVLTALLYLIILKFFDGEKLKDMINYFQIFLSVAMIIGYQLLIRSFELVQLDVIFHLQWWQILIVPLWFGASFEWLFNGNGSIEIVLFSLMALIVPIVSILLYSKMMPSFEQHLQKLSTHSSKGKRKINLWSSLFARIVCPKREERTFFLFGTKMMRQEREFKLKVYPALAISLFLPFIMMLSQLQFRTLEEIFSGKWYFSIYIALLFIPQVVMMLKYSGKYKGAWIYRVSPTQTPEPILKGILKAFFVQLFLPIYFILGTAFVLLFGIEILPDLGLVFLYACLYTMICFKMLQPGLPFSTSFTAMQKSDGWLVIPMFLILGGMGLLHFFAATEGYIFLLLIVFVFFCNLLLWRKGCKVSWESVADQKD
ncbi:hypothetical protein [Caldalkalibacillus mannanilyticus]|uniref:hypothetical protein n=1 Tax=Caldalkalibacillus mannanilyticus TaxID=1418 RepID=UPI00046A5ABF|nr:hypothetical protein [Caldalkalibacillus mannanilyticus]